MNVRISIQPQKLIVQCRKKVYGGLALFLFATLFAGCASIHKTSTITPAETPQQEFIFPEDFLWGAGTSSHQVEGNNTNNDWWRWEQALPLEMRSGQACDGWNRFEEDFRRAQSLGFTAFRFSLEWSRIEPSPGEFDDSALEHYRKMILSLRSKGMEPVVTLNHFTIPLWLVDEGGGMAFGKKPATFRPIRPESYRGLRQ